MLRVLILMALVALPAAAHEPMTVARLGEIVRALDPEAEDGGTAFQLVIEDVPVIIVTDPNADRMRVMVAIRSAAGIAPAEMERMLSANFDTALDARYAVAQGRLWSVFIHPLASLEKNEFLSGLGQVVILALTYGSTYQSGALAFRGGDSAGAGRTLIEDLLKRGEKI